MLFPRRGLAPWRLAGFIWCGSWLALCAASLLADTSISDTVDGHTATITASGTGNSQGVVTSNGQFAGAVYSITWNGQQFIDKHDHGREFQSSVFEGILGQPTESTFLNPTEAGNHDDSTGNSSTSKLLSMTHTANSITTRTQMAYWLSPGESEGGDTAQNTTKLSNVILDKTVTLGALGIPNLIQVNVTFELGTTQVFNDISFEALTGYMPGVFSNFYTWNPNGQVLTHVDDTNAEENIPVIMATANDQFAMGDMNFALPQSDPNWAPDGYAKYQFTTAAANPDEGGGVVKWSSSIRYGLPDGTIVVPGGNYSFTTYAAFGTTADVTGAFAQLIALVPEPSSFALAGLGGCGLCGIAFRRNRRKEKRN